MKLSQLNELLINFNLVDQQLGIVYVLVAGSKGHIAQQGWGYNLCLTNQEECGNVYLETLVQQFQQK